MTAIPSIDLPAWMVEQLSQASPDLLRQMVQTFAEALMSADADATSRAKSTIAAVWRASWRCVSRTPARFNSAFQA